MELFSFAYFSALRKRYVYVVHCPDAHRMGVGFMIDHTGTYVRPEGKGGMFICGRSPDPVSIVQYQGVAWFPSPFSFM